MVFRFRRFEIHTVPEPTPVAGAPVEPVKITPGHIFAAADQAGEVIIKIYAAKKTVDFLFRAAEHIVVTKIQ
jgi:hypothetical protein